MSLRDKVILITGAGRGIGEGLARDLGAQGARIGVHYLNEDAAALATCEAIQASGGQAESFQADLSSVPACLALVQRTAAHFERLDVLINNAGLDPGLMGLFDITEERFDQVMNVNLKGAFFCAQAAARQMVNQGGPGRIISISSIHGRVTLAGRSAYVSSKGGLEAMTRALAMDLAPHGITVNAIAPGFIEVERSIHVIPGYDRQAVGQSLPIGRVGFPSDISALAAFLASDESSFITGQVMVSDGGTTTRMNFRI
ncbi:SDR family NAD(P)-dependent oxidoreductase [Paludibaculum fermentans]|uniref:SDR family NAD(P)-dependent oxidoreductase n=1 Tax=Paludibaculum fermentans TaxID=1473598 RepID=UPI003EBE8B12